MRAISTPGPAASAARRLYAAAVAALALVPPAAAEPCLGPLLLAGKLTEIAEDGTLAILPAPSDGNAVPASATVRPAGVLMAEAAFAAAAPPALAGWTGRAVELHGERRRPDRYGRLSGHVVAAEADGHWLQRDLVAEGLAVVDGRPDACAEALLAVENMARDRRAGVWAGEDVVRRAADPTLADSAPTFAIVAGRIVSTGGSGRTVYLNFGYRWTEDFTVVATGPVADALKRVVPDTAALSGAEVRVRGWMERRGGPYMRLESATALEIVRPRGRRPVADIADDD